MSGEVADGVRGRTRTIPPWSPGRVLLAVLGLALLLPVGLFYLASGLVVPLPWLVVLWAVYLVAVAATVVLVRRHSWWAPAPAVLAAGVWWLTVTLGERLGGWTA